MTLDGVQLEGSLVEDNLHPLVDTPVEDTLRQLVGSPGEDNLHLLVGTALEDNDHRQEDAKTTPYLDCHVHCHPPLFFTRRAGTQYSALVQIMLHQ